MNTDKIIQDQIKIYKDNFLQNKDTSLGTFQNNRETQHLRFERIVRPFKDILNEKVSFHDVGCGVCDMHHYLNSQNIKHDYSGTEILQEMIDHVKQKNPSIKIYKQDLLNMDNPPKYDIVVFSGGLYLPGNIPQDEWKKFVFNIADKMFQMCNIGMSFNLLTTYSTFKTPTLFYLDPKEMFDHCVTNMSRFVNLDHSYPLYEWTISVFRKEYIDKQYPQPEFQKYLGK